MLFWLTVTVGTPFGSSVLFDAVSAILAGGQVEKKPAVEPACDSEDVMMLEPGCCAVAMPFSSMVTMLLVCGA